MKFKTKKISKEDLVEIPEGIFKINASAGTGKTYTLIERYKYLIGSNVKPSDILMITFTNNSAEEIRNRLINNYKEMKRKNIILTDLINSPVMTFHAFCSKLLKKDGLNSPKYLGIAESISGKFTILEDENIEDGMFQDFYMKYKRLNNAGNEEFFEIADENIFNILSIIKKLSSIGIFPNNGKFSAKDKEKLKGNYDKYSELFDKYNEPGIGAKPGEVNNKLYNCFQPKIKEEKYLDFPFDLVKNTEYPKRMNPSCKDEIFNDPQQIKWIDFIGKMYWEYIIYLVRRNYLNYDFLVMFAYLILINNEQVRERNKYKYIMVDEFQDTDEIQFKLILLLAGKKEDSKRFVNLCVVGDWKQGIYGFRNATIENIVSFEDKLEQLTTALQQEDNVTIEGLPDTVYNLDLLENRRSSRKILDAGIKTLKIQAIKDEELSEFDEIEITEVNNFGEDSEILLIKGMDKDEERKIILKKIIHLISDEKNLIYEFDASGKRTISRRVELKDITVLCRDKKFGLELYRLAVNKYKIPAKLNGGVELFSSYPAIILLAWLRVLNDEKDISGWVTILDNEDTRLKNIEKILAEIKNNNFECIHVKLTGFLSHLRSKTDPVDICQSIFGFYEISDNFSDKIITVIGSWMSINKYSLSELIGIIEENALNTFDVEILSSEDSFTIQTIHKSKGLEYPVVFVANINDRNFPSSRPDTDNIYFHPIAGLRVKKLFGTRNNKYLKFSNWRTSLITSMFSKNYDEERRLFYVAVTRAKQFLYMTASKPSRFYKHWEDLTTISDTDFKDQTYEPKVQKKTSFINSEEISFN